MNLFKLNLLIHITSYTIAQHQLVEIICLTSFLVLLFWYQILDLYSTIITACRTEFVPEVTNQTRENLCSYQPTPSELLRRLPFFIGIAQQGFSRNVLIYRYLALNCAIIESTC